MVYKTTPRGSKKQAAGVGIPVSDDTTADPPVSSIAVTRMLVMSPKTVKTAWVIVPYRALITSRKVYLIRISTAVISGFEVTHVCIGSSSFKLNGDGCKQNNLYRCSACIPEGSGDTILICNGRRL